LAVHVGTESLLLTLPGGFAVADAVKIALLRRGSSVDALESLTSLVARRWMLGVSQVLYVVGSIVIGYSLLSGKASAVFPGIAESWNALPTLAVVAVTFITGTFLLMNGGAARRVFRLVNCLSPRFLRDWFDRHRNSFLKINASLRAIGNGRHYELIFVFLMFLSSWLTDTIESVLVARIIGLDIGFVPLLLTEAILSVVKLAGFFLPSGIIVKDLGYVALFNAVGVAFTGSQIAVFVAVKRLINIAWIVIGFAVLFASGFRLPAKKSRAFGTVVELP
jgi:hypothetical protein